MAVIDLKMTDLKTKTQADLMADLGALKQEQMNLRFQKATGQLEKVAMVKKVRRQIARVATVMSEKKLKGEK